MSAAVQDRVEPSAPTRVFTLHPGDVARADRGERLETLLGSCVAIVLTDPRRTVGVMCHIVHAGPALRVAEASGAHAGYALEALYRLLRERSITPRFCDAYVYGGGNMFPALVRDDHVGEKNARWVLDALAADGVRVLHHDVGGNAYRRLRWTVGRDTPQVTVVPV
jgi:chemotaxis protein CheD